MSVTYAAPEFINNLSTELLNNVGKYTEKITVKDDIRVYAQKGMKFRTIIDSAFPTMLVVDYEDIRVELSKYKDILKALQSEVSPDARMPKSSPKLTDRQINGIIKAIKFAFSKLVTKPVSSQWLSQNIKVIVDSAREDNIVLRELKNLFHTDYKVLGAAGPTTEVYLFNNFNRVSTALSSLLGAGLATSGIDAEIDGVSDYLNYGHTATGFTEGTETNLYFNSPKLIAIIFDILNSNTKSISTNTLIANTVTNFIQTTNQIDSYVTVTKEFSEGFMSVFVSIGGNVVKFENKDVNQLKGSTLETKEKFGVNTVVRNKLADSFKSLGKTLANQIGRAMTIGRGSPSALDYITDSVVKSLLGIKPTRFKEKKSSTKRTTTKNKVKSKTISGIAKRSGVLIAPPGQTSPTQSLNLANLQILMDRHLQDVVAANMGSGGERRVLNYRTGRLAESAKVEGLSASRDGMITAFYSYMRNPYGTFSDGGKQQYPKTRDPKLLIGNSIREIAATVVGNRLRAVLV